MVTESIIDPNLLKILACPESHQPLDLLDSGELERINDLIKSGAARMVSGESFKSSWNAGLIRQDKLRAYQILDGLPILLIESAIVLPS